MPSVGLWDMGGPHVFYGIDSINQVEQTWAVLVVVQNHHSYMAASSSFPMCILCSYEGWLCAIYIGW
jgi:hypothetical protein